MKGRRAYKEHSWQRICSLCVKDFGWVHTGSVNKWLGMVGALSAWGSGWKEGGPR